MSSQRVDTAQHGYPSHLFFINYVNVYIIIWVNYFYVTRFESNKSARKKLGLLMSTDKYQTYLDNRERSLSL